MRAASRFQSIGKILYTQNPFYLISCGLILYGIHLAGPNNLPLEMRSWILAAAMAGYTLLMAVTAIGVIRIGKVWQDARSILMVVIIGLIGLSASFDQLCIFNWKLAATLLGGCFLFAVFIAELIFASCKIRIGILYRIPLYLILIAFFALPVVAGYAVEQQQEMLKNWMAVVFSVAVAGGLITLSPAIRRGASYLQNNGTPWQWPLFPLSAFVVLIVLAAIRSHAIWMSFSTLSGPIALEPFLLMPFIFAIAWLLIEFDSHSHDRTLTYTVMMAMPAVLFAGISNAGLTALPVGSEMHFFFGSATSLIAILVCVFYTAVWMRGIYGAGYFLAAMIMFGALAMPMPELFRQLGAQNWMIAVLATGMFLGLSVVNFKSDWNWTFFATFATISLALAGRDMNLERALYPAAFVVLIVSAMLIGGIFKSGLAAFLRGVAAISISFAAVAVGIYQTMDTQIIVAVALITLTILPIVYLMLVRRRGWLWVVVNNITWAAISFAFVSHELLGSLIEQRAQMALPGGIVCFAIAIFITSAKTGALESVQRRLRGSFQLRNFQVGL